MERERSQRGGKRPRKKVWIWRMLSYPHLYSLFVTDEIKS